MQRVETEALLTVEAVVEAARRCYPFLRGLLMLAARPLETCQLLHETPRTLRGSTAFLSSALFPRPRRRPIRREKSFQKVPLLLAQTQQKANVEEILREPLLISRSYLRTWLCRRLGQSNTSQPGREHQSQCHRAHGFILPILIIRSPCNTTIWIRHDFRMFLPDFRGRDFQIFELKYP
ncbi:MAG: hypothetical protein QM605_08690 [Sphingobium sp.]